MELQLRHIELQHDYPTLDAMWKAWKFPSPPIEALPDTGLIVTNFRGDPIAAGFLYKTNSTLAWMEWIVASMFCTKAERATGLDMLIEHLEAWAHVEGFTTLFTCSKNASYSHKLKKLEWIPTDTGMNHFIRRLG